MIINDLDGYYIVFDTKNWNTELDTLFIRIFHNKLLLWLGSISFEIFLCHNLCFRIIQSIFLKRYGEGNPHQEFQFILSLAFIILTAWIAKKAIVLPIQHQLQKYL